MAESDKTSAKQPAFEAGPPSDPELDSFPTVQANPGTPLDDPGDDCSTNNMTRRDLSSPDSTPEAQPDVPVATARSLTGDADADAATVSPPVPSPAGSGRDAGRGDVHAKVIDVPPPGENRATASEAPKPRTDAADQDATTLAQLIEARVLEPPDADALRRGAIAVLDKRYELKRKLGEGGMGIVYLAFDRLGDCEVAIKTLRPRFLLDAESRRRFIDEAKQMNRVPSHAHVLVVKGFGTESRPYYVMENMSGGSLGKLIRKEGPLPRDKAIKLAFDIAKAIEYLHESSGQIHRDIKPENVLLAADGSAWLCDFGLIRQVGIGATGLRAGTLAYMPPEVVTDITKNVAFDWDIYSFGAVLYEMICGKRPYDELFNVKTSPIEQMRLMKDEVMRRPPKPIHEVCKKADPALARIAQWCMAREARERYYRITDVLRDLERVNKDKAPLGPRQIGAAVPKPRNIAVRAAAVVVILALVGLAAVAVFNPLNLREDILVMLGLHDPPGQRLNKDRVVVPVGATDGTAPDGPVHDGRVPEPPRPVPAVVKTGNAVVDAMNPDASFKIVVRTAQDRTSYIEGEALRFEITYDRPCYPLVLSVSLEDPNEPVTVLFPSRSQMEAPKPGSTLSIPAPGSDVILRCRPPHGRTLIKVIASDVPLLLSDGTDESDGGFLYLKLGKIQVATPSAEPDAPLVYKARIDELLRPSQWATAELVFTTKEK